MKSIRMLYFTFSARQPIVDVLIAAVMNAGSVLITPKELNYPLRYILGSRSASARMYLSENFLTFLDTEIHSRNSITAILGATVELECKKLDH